MAGGINRPVLPTTGATPDEQRLRSGVSEIVRTFLNSQAFLQRLLVGPIIRAATGQVAAVGWNQMNRVSLSGDAAIRLPPITPPFIGVPLYITKVTPTGIMNILGAGNTPSVDSSPTGIQRSAVGLTALVNDGLSWFSVGDEDSFTIRPLSSVRYADAATVVPVAQQTGSQDAPFAIIQSAIDSLTGDGVVFLAPGNYPGAISGNGKHVSLIGLISNDPNELHVTVGDITSNDTIALVNVLTNNLTAAGVVLDGSKVASGFISTAAMNFKNDSTARNVVATGMYLLCRDSAWGGTVGRFDMHNCWISDAMKMTMASEVSRAQDCEWAVGSLTISGPGTSVIAVDTYTNNRFTAAGTSLATVPAGGAFTKEVRS